MCCLKTGSNALRDAGAKEGFIIRSLSIDILESTNIIEANTIRLDSHNIPYIIRRVVCGRTELSMQLRNRFERICHLHVHPQSAISGLECKPPWNISMAEINIVHGLHKESN